MPFAEIFGANYHYQMTGDGPPLLLLHGFTGSSDNWTPLIPTFTAHFQTITVDLLGHGQTTAPSDPERYAMAEAATDLVELLNQLRPEPVHLLGYSMGGRLALYLALHYPVHFQSLILESASPGLRTQAERNDRVKRDHTLADKIENDGIPAFVQYWESLPLFRTQQRIATSVREQLHQQRLRNDSRGLANSLRGMGTGVQPSLWDRLANLNIPVLLLTGALDTKFVAIAKQMAKSLPDATLSVIPDAGHTIHLEQPGIFSGAVLHFLGGDARS